MQLSSLTTNELTSGFFGGWRVKELQELMEYIQVEEMSVAGFDVQRSGSNFTEYLNQRLKSVVNLEKLESDFVKVKTKLSNYKTDFKEVNEETEHLITDYRQVLNKFIKGGERFISETLSNRINYLEYMLRFVQTKDWNERWKARDLAMAENVNWILSQYPDDTKAIIIGHNFHIAKYNKNEEVMGEFLQSDFFDDIYVLGVFAKDGEFHNNYGQVESLSPVDTNKLDIKHIIESDQTRMSFLNIPSRLTKASKWLKKPIVVNDTFIDLSKSNTLILSKCFDGLLLLDSVSPPNK